MKKTIRSKKMKMTIMTSCGPRYQKLKQSPTQVILNSRRVPFIIDLSIHPPCPNPNSTMSQNH